MTFGILRDNSMERDVMDSPVFERDYELLGCFYEHSRLTAGHVYEQEALESYLEISDVDPADAEGPYLVNHKDDLADLINNLKALVFKKEMESENKIIKNNYLLYEVYIKS